MKSLLKCKKILVSNSNEFESEYVVSVVCFDSINKRSFLIELGLGATCYETAVGRAMLASSCAAKVEERAETGMRFFFASREKSGLSFPALKARAWTSEACLKGDSGEAEYRVISRVSRLISKDCFPENGRIFSIGLRANPQGGLKMRLTLRAKEFFTRCRIQLGLGTRDMSEAMARVLILYHFFCLAGMFPGGRSQFRLERNVLTRSASRCLELLCTEGVASDVVLSCPKYVQTFASNSGKYGSE